MVDDRILLTSWARGDADAGSQLLRRHFDSLWRFFRSKAEEDVDELLQRTMLACVEKRSLFRGESTFRSFLFGIARIELLNHYQRRQRHGYAVNATVSSAEDLFPSASQLLANEDTMGRLLQALRAIPLDLQIALELFYWEGATALELAEALNVPEGTIRSRLRRGRQLIRDHMADAAGVSTTVANAELDQWAKELRVHLTQTSDDALDRPSC